MANLDLTVGPVMLHVDRTRWCDGNVKEERDGLSSRHATGSTERRHRPSRDVSTVLKVRGVDPSPACRDEGDVWEVLVVHGRVPCRDSQIKAFT